MASLFVKATDLSEGDTLLLPFGKTATIRKIHVPGPRGRYVQLWTEYGKTRIGVDERVNVEAKVV